MTDKTTDKETVRHYAVTIRRTEPGHWEGPDGSRIVKNGPKWDVFPSGASRPAVRRCPNLRRAAKWVHEGLAWDRKLSEWNATCRANAPKPAEAAH